MKRVALSIAIVITFVSVVYATITVTYDVPDAKYLKYLNAFVAQSNADVTITVVSKDAPAPDSYATRVQFATPQAIDPNTASNAQIKAFVKDRVALITSAFKTAHEQKLKADALAAYLNSAPVIDVNEPDANDLEN